MIRLGLWGLALLYASCQSVPMDGALPADLAGDKTVILRAQGPGCISKPEVGFSFCRKAEGEVVRTDRIDVFAPATNIDCDPCTEVILYDLSGAPVASRAFGKNGGMASVQWSEILDSSEFRRTQEGAYNVVLTHRFENNDGREQRIIQRGLIYLLVYLPIENAEPRRVYQPLHRVRESSVWAFSKKHESYLMKWSTAGRAYVGDHR